MNQPVAFGEQTESKMLSLGGWMKFVGTVQAVLCGLGMLFVGVSLLAVLTAPLLALPVLVLGGVVGVYLWQGVLTISAGDRFRDIATENDRELLVFLFEKLRPIFIIEAVVAGIRVVAVIWGML